MKKRCKYVLIDADLHGKTLHIDNQFRDKIEHLLIIK